MFAVVTSAADSSRSWGEKKKGGGPRFYRVHSSRGLHFQIAPCLFFFPPSVIIPQKILLGHRVGGNLKSIPTRGWHYWIEGTGFVKPWHGQARLQPPRSNKPPLSTTVELSIPHITSHTTRRPSRPNNDCQQRAILPALLFRPFRPLRPRVSRYPRPVLLEICLHLTISAEFDFRVLNDGRSAMARYANNSNYRNDSLIRKESRLSFSFSSMAMATAMATMGLTYDETSVCELSYDQGDQACN